MKKKYELIIEEIEGLVIKNQLKQGERLPSIREMANRYQCNKSTVIRAYQELEMNHKIYSIPKGGYYLVEKKNTPHDVYEGIDFSEVVPDGKLLPYKEFNHCINKAIELYKDSLFSYGDTQGLASLRSVLVKHFQDYQVFTTADKIFITSGAQQALSILSKMPFPNGKKNILVEQPTYGLIHRIAAMNGNPLIGIPRDNSGIDLKELEQIFKTGNIKFFYTIPRFHNPLGTCYTEKQKKKIVELAEKYDVYILEDDYLADLDTNKKSLPIYSYGVCRKVLYVKSFSKTFMPGIRIGAVVLDEALREEFLKHKKCDDLSTSILAQGALEIFINSGMYKNHLKKTQTEYRKKMEYLKECLRGVNTEGIEVFIPETGFFVWIRLSKTIAMDRLEKRLEEKRIVISPAKNYFIGSDSKENSFRVCISKLTKEEIRVGIDRLWQEIDRMRF